MIKFGGTGAKLEELPLGGSRTFYRALVASSICDVIEATQRGLIMYRFMSGAQIDPYGDLNSTVIGDHARSKVRFPGSGGANDVGSLVWRTIAIKKHRSPDSWRRWIPLPLPDTDRAWSTGSRWTSTWDRTLPGGE